MKKTNSFVVFLLNILTFGIYGSVYQIKLTDQLEHQECGLKQILNTKLTAILNIVNLVMWLLFVVFALISVSNFVSTPDYVFDVLNAVFCILLSFSTLIFAIKVFDFNIIIRKIEEQLNCSKLVNKYLFITIFAISVGVLLLIALGSYFYIQESLLDDLMLEVFSLDIDAVINILYAMGIIAIVNFVLVLIAYSVVYIFIQNEVNKIINMTQPEPTFNPNIANQTFNQVSVNPNNQFNQTLQFNATTQMPGMTQPQPGVVSNAQPNVNQFTNSTTNHVASVSTQAVANQSVNNQATPVMQTGVTQQQVVNSQPQLQVVNEQQSQVVTNMETNNVTGTVEPVTGTTTPEVNSVNKETITTNNVQATTPSGEVETPVVNHQEVDGLNK